MKTLLKSFIQVLAAVVVVLLILEAVCFIAGMPQGAARYIESVALRNHLSTHKPKGEFRVFTYGESTMHGSHYWPYSNPAVWLDAYLRDFLPGKKIKVVNFARMGSNGYFVKESFRDTLAYAPDVAVVYMGHNSFLPGAGYREQLEKRRGWKYFLRDAVRRSRVISSAVRYGISKRLEKDGKESIDQVGFEKIETPPTGIGPEHKVLRHSEYYNANIEAFKRNVSAIVEMAAENHVRLILMKPASNLKDFPPGCSDHLTKLSPADAKNWDAFFKEGQKAEAAGDLTQALSFYENAASLDDSYAELAYRIGQIYLGQGDLVKAKRMFENARDNDCLIVRATKEKLEFFDGLSESGKAIVLDSEKILNAEALGGIMGFPVVEDNVHFSPKGHARIGRALAQEIADRDWFVPKKDWQFNRLRSYDEMAKSLGVTSDVFFESYLQCVTYFGHKFDSRIFMAQKALEIHPGHPKALRHLAWGYWLKGDKKNAVKIYSDLKKHFPDEFAAAMQNAPDLKKAFEEFSVPSISSTQGKKSLSSPAVSVVKEEKKSPAV